jgi:sec-independent protein translocase protein TatB
MFDFGLGTSEILLIAVVALIVLGPKDLPRLLRTVGQYMRKIQGMAREFQNHLNEAAKEAGIDDVKKEVKGMTNFTVTADLDKQGSEIKRAIEQSAQPAIAAAAASNGAGGKEETAQPAPAPAAISRPIAATEPVAPLKAKPVRQKAEPKPKPAASKSAPKPKPAPKPKAGPKADTAREAAKS